MSYVGFIAEELMRGREDDTRRLTEAYRQRAAAKAGRRSRRARPHGRGAAAQAASANG